MGRNEDSAFPRETAKSSLSAPWACSTHSLTGCRFPRCFLPACILMCSVLHITHPTDVSALAHFRGIMFNRLSYLEMQKAGWCFSSPRMHKQHSAFDLGLHTLHKRLSSLRGGEAARPFSLADAPLTDIHECSSRGTLGHSHPSSLLPGPLRAPIPLCPALCESLPLATDCPPSAGHTLGIVHNFFLSILHLVPAPASRQLLWVPVASAALSLLPALVCTSSLLVFLHSLEFALHPSFSTA